LVAPVGEGVGGIIAQTNALVGELGRQELVDLKVIDSTQRYRDDHNLRFFSRAWGGTWQALRIGVELLAALRTFKPETVQIRSSASLGLTRDMALAALAKLCGTKVYVSFHFGRIPQLAIQRNWEWHLLSWTIQISRRVQVLDRHSASLLAEKFPHCKISQFANGIDCGWIDEISDRVRIEKANRSIPRLVFVGMLHPAKGVVELVEACSRILDPDFELEMVGPVGPEMKEQLCGIAAGREEGHWLKFTGPLSRKEAVARIAAADVFVIPSFTEGFPGTVLEAMACSVAIVATSVGAIPEMLLGNEGEVAGIIVTPRDTESLKLAVETLLMNPTKRSELGAAARRKCEASYQLSDLARRWAVLWSGHESSSKPS
jgi:glycosyltransferase involved in cell wall biosynthesis